MLALKRKIEIKNAIIVVTKYPICLVSKLKITQSSEKNKRIK
jgi:hypothetical protein